MDYSRVRGVNYCCSYGPGLRHLWDHFDKNTVDRELGYAAALGFNSVRVWLNFHAFAENPAQVLRNIDTFLECCASHRLTALPIFFDSCGVEASDYSGETIPRKGAFERHLGDPGLPSESKDRLRAQLSCLAESVGADGLVPFSKNDPSTLIWQWHTPSPGYSLLDRKEHWPEYERYVVSILDRLGDHPQVLMWDVMNEPYCVRVFTPGWNPAIVDVFLAHFAALAASRTPRKPITIGHTADLKFVRQWAPAQDVLSFHYHYHRYNGDSEKFRVLMHDMRSVAEETGKSILLTEGFGHLFPKTAEEFTEHHQLKLLRENLPVILEAKIGFYIWQLMDGLFPWSWTGLMHVDGLRKSAAQYVAETFRKLG